MNRVGTSWCFIMQQSSYLLIISESNEVGYERGGYFLKSVFFSRRQVPETFSEGPM